MKTEILLNHADLVLKPEMDAVHEIECELNTGIMALSQKLVDGTITLRELVVILMACIEPKQSKGFIENLITRSGFSQAIEAVAGVFSILLEGEVLPNRSGLSRETIEGMIAQFPDNA